MGIYDANVQRLDAHDSSMTKADELGSQKMGLDDVVCTAAAGLARLCASCGIDDSHGHGHALAVLAHVDKAIAAATAPLPVHRILSVRLAALLHDADDRKYFPGTTGYPNAVRLMEVAGAQRFGDAVIPDAVRMISLVSCSANGNSCPADATDNAELLWPRWADRLEATGEIGVVRCYEYNKKVGAPLSCDTTPRPTSDDEAWALATPERFEEYQSSGGDSASMIDHYYDKLLRVARPPSEVVRNRYLEEAALSRVQPLLTVCLSYGATGIVPEAAIEVMARELGR